MKIRQSCGFDTPPFALRAEIIAAFGSARLVRKSDGRHELIGGTAADLTAVREWCSLFAHEVFFTVALQQKHPVAFAA